MRDPEKATNDVSPAPRFGLTRTATECLTIGSSSISVQSPPALPDIDSDGDGMTNYAEFVAGTNPMNAADNLAPIATAFDGTTLR